MVLQLNDRGDSVKELQIKLGLTADGSFGPKTQAALMTFQKNNGLTADGVAGPITLARLGIVSGQSPVARPDNSKLTKEDFVAGGKLLNCHPGMIEALALKESHGAAFLSDGRPKILFERHQFYRRLAKTIEPGRSPADMLKLRETAFKNDPDICNPNRGGYLGGVAEYSRLDKAKSYSETAALESASWGQFQIMGFNAVPIGYSSVQEFVRLMQQNIGEHLVALERFVLNTPNALKGIRNQDFAMLAAAYNGPAYKENKYDTDLKKFFDRVKGNY